MLFSILIANYNNGQYFKDCYDSIIAQTYHSWEVIIVDDCSTDDSVQVINQIVGTDQRFKIYENEINQGCGYSKKICVELATGQLCGFLDPDDALYPNALGEMVLEHIKDEYALVHSSFIFCDQNLIPVSEYHLAKAVVTDIKFTNLNNAVTAFASFRKDYYEKSIGINPLLKRAVDQDLYLKMAEIGSFYYLNKILYKYRIHDRGIASNNEGKALYAHLKVIYDAEIRRGVDMEKEVGECIKKIDDSVLEKKDDSLGYLWLQVKFLMKRAFRLTVDKLIKNRS